MEPIRRGKGVTHSERYLARLADSTFLELWSYPNTFIDKRSAPTADGKELADLLVVCGDDVIIFSDKSVAWPPGNIQLSWARWYRRAVKKSVDQIRGAERWLRQFPERVFLDPACTKRLPIELPPLARRRVHGIAVALGAQAACSSHFSEPDGSLMVCGHLKGDAHTDTAADDFVPFAFGDVDPDGPFVHVFDETALDFVLRELDTVSDFVRYLTQREKAIRAGQIFHAASEADLLGFYLQCKDETGRPHFPDPSETRTDGFVLAPGLFREWFASREYHRVKAERKPSYIWDRLIRVFADNIIAGTSVEIAGELPNPKRAEPALRIMALENRIMRQALGSMFADVLQQAEREAKDRFVRVVLPTHGGTDPEVCYVFLVLAYPKDFELADGYAQYRRTRVSILETYCYVALHENRQFKRVVGVAIDASSRVTGRQGGSEDLIAVEVAEWTPELEREVQERRRHFDVLSPPNVRAGRYVDPEKLRRLNSGLSRQQRRALERMYRKRKR